MLTCPPDPLRCPQSILDGPAYHSARHGGGEFSHLSCAPRAGWTSPSQRTVIDEESTHFSAPADGGRTEVTLRWARDDCDCVLRLAARPRHAYSRKSRTTHLYSED